MVLKRKLTFIVFIPLIAIAVVACQPNQEPAEMVLRGGKIVTVDESKPEAAAAAIRDDRFVAVGTEEEIEPYIGPSTKVIDLEGSLAIVSVGPRRDQTFPAGS